MTNPQGDPIPRYTAEIRIYDKGDQSQPVYTLMVSGSAKVVQETVAAGIESFREDAER